MLSDTHSDHALEHHKQLMHCYEFLWWQL